MVIVNILLESGYKVDRKRVREVVRRVVEERAKQKPQKGFEVNVEIVGEETMRDLGKKWMKDEDLHEVLSFPTEELEGPDGIIRLGDVVVCYPMVTDNLEFLIEHGCLHLLGIHHD